MQKLSEEELEIEQFKIKRLLRELGSYRGNGTSLITVMIQSGGDLNGMKRTLVEEYGTATNIKSRVNRQSVLSAIQSAQHKLKGFTKLPENGLVLFSGEPFTGKKVSVCFEPFKRLGAKMYKCDSCFHVEPLEALLQQDEEFGFIIIDGSGALFGKLTGRHKDVLFYYKVQLPKKHRKGGQSSARFGRLAQEARHLYITKVAEMAIKYFITNNEVNVKGIIVAGSAEMKDKLTQLKDLDGRIRDKIVSVITISYGGISGFDEAIEQSAPILSDLKCIQEKKELQKFFELISIDSGIYCYGAKDTIQALEIGAVEKLLVCDQLEYRRLCITDADGNKTVEYVLPDQLEKTLEKYNDSTVGTNSGNSIENESLLDWTIEHYKEYGANIVILSDSTAEGTQFYKGFGGVGGILRWKVDFDHYAYDFDSDDSDDSEFM